MAESDSYERQLERARSNLQELPDADRLLEYSHSVETRKSKSTAITYSTHIRYLAERLDGLTDLSLEAIDDVLEELEAEYAASTLAIYQSTLKDYLRQYDLDVEPDEIPVVSSGDQDQSVDERTVLSEDEFFELRTAAPNWRDRALIDLFAYTGQRHRVIQNLKIRDLEPDTGPTGVYYMPDVEGTKGAEEAMRKRPLLGAKRAVEDWLQAHPTRDPDDYFITAVEGPTVGERLGQAQIGRRLKQAADRAEIDKPVTPHALRHYFATAAKRDYGMDNETIRRLLGHGPDSNIMETTYQHLSDDDIIAEAEAAFGEDVEEESTRLTPPVCDVCREPIPRGVAECQKCGYRYVHDLDGDLPPSQQVRQAQTVKAVYDAQEDMHDLISAKLKELS